MLKRNLPALAAIALVMSATADGRKYYYCDKVYQQNPNNSANYIDPSTGGELSAFDNAGDYWLVQKGRIKTQTNISTFNGAEFNIGSPSQKPSDWNDAWPASWWGNTYGRLYSFSYVGSTGGSFTFNNLVWWNGLLYVPADYADKSFQFCGTYTIRQADSDVSHESYMDGPHPYVEFNATVLSSDDDIDAADAVWTIRASSTASSLDNLVAGTSFVWRMTGDHSSYKGSINVTAAYQPLVIYNGTIIGDASEPDMAAITLGNNAAIAFAADFAQGTARGIQLSGAQAYLATWESLANEYTIEYPISKADGAAGALVKRGPGTVTINGDYSAGPLTVHSGTLVIGSEASFAPGTEICVEAGARLESYLPLSQFSITGEGTAERKVVPIAVPFDPGAAGEKTTPVELSYVDTECVQPLRLSTPIPLPLHDGLKVPLARYVGSGVIAPTCFSDITEKSSGLPNTHLTVENEDDVQVVYLTADPVVVSVADFNQYPAGGPYVTFNGVDGQPFWSDSRAAHSDADYLFTNGMYCVSATSFNGRSLVIGETMATEDQLRIRKDCILPNVIVWPTTKLRQGSSENPTVNVGGSACLMGDYGNYYTLCVQNKYVTGKALIDFSADLTGSGTLLLAQWARIEPTDPLEFITLSGDNSSFQGKIIAMGKGWLNLNFNEPANLGGALPEFHADALDLRDQVMLRPLQTMTLGNDVNRGIKVSSEAGLYVTNGVTFTSLRPLLLEHDFQLSGEGEFRLGGVLSLGSAATRSLYVRSGGSVCALNDAAVAGLGLVASNDFTIVVVAGLETGFAGLSFDGGARPKVHVRLDAASVDGKGGCETAICTIDDDSGLDVGDFVVERVRGYDCKLVKTPVGGNRSRFALECSTTGFVISFR